MTRQSGLSVGFDPTFTAAGRIRRRVSRLDPWPHFVADGLLKQGDLVAAQHRILNRVHRFRIKPGDPQKIRYKLIDDIPLARIFLSQEFGRFLQVVTGQALAIHPANLVQLRRMDRRSPEFPRHVDFFRSEPSYVCVFFLSPGWTSECGGRLRLHKAAGDEERSLADIEPVANRLVLFRSSRDHWHSIERVFGGWVRYSVLSEWLFESPETVPARVGSSEIAAERSRN